MAKIVTSPLFESVSGKLCKNDTQVVMLNKKTGKMSSYECHPGEQPNTAEQKAVRAIFTETAQKLRVWWESNKPSTATPKGSADYQQLKKLYDAQSKIGNIYGFARSRVNKDTHLLDIATKTIDLGITGSGTASSGGTTGGNSQNPPSIEDA